MYKDILLPVDLSQEGSWHKALEISIELCRAFGCRLHIVSVLPEYKTPMVASYFPEDFEEKHREVVDQQMHQFVKEHVPEECKVQVIVAEGTSVYKEIIHSAEQVDADLIVMGSHVPEFKDYLLGPNAERVVRHAKQSVMVVREDEE